MYKTLPPPNISVTVYIPSDGINTRMIDDIIPGKVRGSVILIKVVILEAPKSAEASKRDLFNFSIELYIGRTANGRGTGKAGTMNRRPKKRRSK